jgi:hypothetical protein
MKDETTTYLFDDGTEPTVRRMPKGLDYQGRYPEAAEAATEVGQEDEKDANLAFLWAVVAILVITIIAIGVAIWGEGQ